MRSMAPFTPASPDTGVGASFSPSASLGLPFPQPQSHAMAAIQMSVNMFLRTIGSPSAFSNSPVRFARAPVRHPVHFAIASPYSAHPLLPARSPHQLDSVAASAANFPMPDRPNFAATPVAIALPAPRRKRSRGWLAASSASPKDRAAPDRASARLA